MNSPRRLFPLLLGILVLGCARGGGGSDPVLPDAGQAGAPRVSAELAIAEFLLTADPSTLEASLAQSRNGVARPPQTLNYDLDLAQFLTPDVLRVQGVSRNGAGDLVIRLRHAHPYAAPDLSQPPDARNRADLGYSGRLLALVERTQEAFFDGTIRLDPTTIRRPDGYVDAGDLLAHPGLTNNTFPYMLLVDETRDNRIGITNNFSPVGSYASQTGGWQRANLGDTGDAWTGYDYLHAGQASLIDLTIARPALSDGPLTLPLALLIKYSDPRSSTTPDSYFPPETVDPTAFAYRLPYAALDCSEIVAPETATIGTATGAIRRIQVHVRDWDARATAALQPDLSLESDVSLIQPGAQGSPVLEFDCPGLSPAPQRFTEYYGGSGLSYDLIGFQLDVANTLGTAPEGIAWGLIRALDPEDGDPLAADYRFGVDPETLIPDATRALAVRTYQPVAMEVRPATTPGEPFAYFWGGFSTINGITCATLDAESNIYMGGYLAKNGNPGTPSDLDPTATEDLHVVQGPGDPFIAKFSPAGAYLWGRTWGNDAVNGVVSDQVTGLAFDATSNTLLVAGQFMGTVDLDPGAGIHEVTSPAFQNFHTFLSRFTPEGLFLNGVAFGSEELFEWSVVNAARCDEAGNFWIAGTFQGTVDFDPGPGIAEQVATGGRDVFLARYTNDLIFGGVWTIAGTYEEAVYALDLPPDGVLLAGTYRDADFDPGTGVQQRTVTGEFATDAWLLKLDRTGTFQWVRTWGDPGDFRNDSVRGIAHDATGRIALVGAFAFDATDFDPGPDEHILPAAYRDDGYLLVLDDAGNFEFARTWDGGLGDFDIGLAVTVDSTGNWLIAGSATPRDGDASVLKYTADGTAVWSRAFLTNEYGSATTVLPLADGGMIVMGSSSPITDMDPGPGQDLRAEGGVPLMLAARLNADGLRD